MSFGFDLTEKPSENILMGGNVESIDEHSPSTFEGVGTGIGQGFMKGGANVGRFVGMAGAVAPILYDAVTGDTKAQDWYFENVIDDTLTRSVDYWTPDAKEVGKAGQLLGGLSGIALPLMVGGGSPSVLIGDSFTNPAVDLINQGVDSTTASTVGAINAAATGIGFALPFFGKTLSQRMASGIGGNLVVNTVATAMQQQALENSGNSEIAKQYDPFDPTARTLDVLTGAVFGGIAHVGAPRIKPSERDAVLTANNAKNFQHDSAIGVPLDIKSSVAHQNALEASINAFMRGEPVEVSAIVENAAFVQNKKNKAQLKEINTVLSENANINLNQELQSRITNNFKEVEDAYSKIDGTDGGRVLDAGLARELSSGYRNDRTLASDVQDSASAAIKKLYEQKLAKPTPEGLTPDVVFMAGGTGAGKSTVKEAFKDDLKSAEIIYDTTMSNMASADVKIQQALEANRYVTIVYTYREIEDAFTSGSLGRAARSEKETGSGRTTPLDVFIEKHVGAQKTIAEIIEKYKGDPRVQVRAIDNSNGQGNHEVVDFAKIPKIDDTELRGRLYEAAIKEFEAGRISEAIFDSTIKNTRRDEGASRQNDGERDSESSQVNTGNNAKNTIADGLYSTNEPALSAHDVEAAQKIFNNNPDLVVTLEDGSRATVRELMDSIAAENKQFENDSKAYDAAVACFLGGA